MAILTIEQSGGGSQDNVIIMNLEGEIDESNQHELEARLQLFLGDDLTVNVVFNLSNLDYMNSGVIGLFVSYHEQFSAMGKSFVFSSSNEDVFSILELVGVPTVIDCFDSDEEACLSFEQ
ncbi:hypothetical protein COB57_03780 [Candidatus Peregrinibacteria bacterium]|nr:MAG: hypothetical protein COB57_03780 [Candidatus Peregrinibacteria bacterium]